MIMRQSLTKKERLQLSVSYKNASENFGFSNKSYANQPFIASAWVKTSAPQCVKIGFYRGNNSAFGWTDYNDYGDGVKYELIAYKDYFDSPYTQNGNLYFEINSNCEVEIAKPMVVIQ